ncbi:MAG: type IV pilin protein [Nitrospirales bacterium]
MLRDSRGLTILEILTALLVLGILSAIAFPVYTSFTQKAKMVEGETTMYEIAKLEDTFFSSENRFTADLAELGYDPQPPLKYYGVTVTLGDGNPIVYEAFASTAETGLDSFVLTKFFDGSYTVERVSTALDDVPDSGDDGGGAGGGAGGDDGSSGDKKEKKDKKDKKEKKSKKEKDKEDKDQD